MFPPSPDAGRTPSVACARRRVGAASRMPGLVAALARRPGFWFLDSALERLPLGRFSFAGADPWCRLEARGDALTLVVDREVRADLPRGRHHATGDPLDAISGLVGRSPVDAPDALPFVGGAVGYLGYELARFTEGSVAAARDEVGAPDLTLLGVDGLLAMDALEDRVDACALGFGRDPRAARAAAERALSRFLEELPDEARAGEGLGVDPGAPVPWRPSPELDAESHAKAVGQILHAIGEGSVYQVNLTHPIQVPFAGDPWLAYRILRQTNPAPFAAYLALPGVHVLSSSPERFLSLTPAGVVESRPIKGTRARGGDPERDARAGRELLASEKDRAENVMIVDLVRNDLGRVCETGSIHVSELRVLEPYATVHQMVSTVRGRLHPDRSAVDLLRATFPPGSMTGAPKRAAIAIAAALEPVRRGIYSGALGWFDVRGGLDLSVVIRTALVTGGRAFVHAGGGIVADSDPAAEWQESWDKAAAVTDALARASDPLR